MGLAHEKTPVRGVDPGLEEPASGDPPPRDRTRARGPWARAGVRLAHDPVSMVSLIVVVALFVAGLLAFLLPLPSPLATDPLHRLVGPSWSHPLGTDNLGRDLLSRVVHGGRYTIAIGAIAAVLGAALGTLLGVGAGYTQRLDAAIMRLTDIWLAFPSILIALAVVASVGGGFGQTVAAVAIANAPKFVRLSRAQTLSLKNRPFVESARCSGITGARIVRRHILPNVVGVVVVYTTVRLGTGIMIAATLGFLGLGVSPPTPAWGVMLSDARSYIVVDPTMLIVPAAAIFVAVMCANLVGDGLRDALDPKSTTGDRRYKRLLKGVYSKPRETSSAAVPDGDVRTAGPQREQVDG